MWGVSTHRAWLGEGPPSRWLRGRLGRGGCGLGKVKGTSQHSQEACETDFGDCPGKSTHRPSRFPCHTRHPSCPSCQDTALGGYHRTPRGMGASWEQQHGLTQGPHIQGSQCHRPWLLFLPCRQGRPGAAAESLGPQLPIYEVGAGEDVESTRIPGPAQEPSSF